MSRLIISTGDVSDVDGFYALSVYAKTGADCLFIMNYPSYVADPAMTNSNKSDPGKLPPGLGYQYPASALMTKGTPPVQAFVNGDDAHRTLTNYGYSMSKYVWTEASSAGRLFFQIGGVNSINPFSSSAIKIEPVVYKAAFTEDKPVIDISQIGCKGLCIEGTVLTTDQTPTMDFTLTNYDEIYIDFCGSMAFLTDEWVNKLEEVSGKIKGVFIMGGVRADVPPETMSAIPKTLNRFSCATMNQLYHPENSARFLKFLENHNPKPSLMNEHVGVPTFPVYIVTNNSVPDLKTVADIESFLDMNGMSVKETPFLRALEQQYYASPYAPAKKQAFDFYAAKALVDAISNNLPNFPKAVIYYDDKYGVTLVKPGSATNANTPPKILQTFIDVQLGKKIADTEAIVSKATADAEAKTAEGDMDGAGKARGLAGFMQGSINSFKIEQDKLRGIVLSVYDGAYNVKYNRDASKLSWNSSTNN